VDAEGATQILTAPPPGATAVAKTRVAGTRAPTPDTPALATQVQAAPRKKAPVMAIAAAVGVLAVGGGVTVMMLSHGNVPAAGADSTRIPGQTAVTRDTAQRTAERHHSVPPTGAADNRTNTQRTVTPPPRETTVVRTEAPPAHRGIPVSVAAASDRLNTLFDRFDVSGHTPPEVAAGIRDTALAYYNATGIARKDQAFAAYILSNAQTALDNKGEALRWARTAVQLDPTMKSYQVLVGDLSRQP